MRLVQALACGIALALVIPAVRTLAQMDPDRVVPNGGITVSGWKGKIDASSIKQGRTINDSKFAPKGKDIEIAAGPAAVYWNPSNTASGDYTVKATFTEPAYMSANSHPHPYGIFIGGSKMDTDQMTLLYCVPYGNGNVLVRGFNPTATGRGGNVTGVFTVQPPTANAAVKKAEKGASVTQEVAWMVKGSRAECSINGAVVASYDKNDLIGPGKLDSLDGVYGIRVSHNLDVVVSGLAVTK
jgi:hypothetical protein